MDATVLVRNLYEAYQRRDWNAAAELFHLRDGIEYWVTVGGEQPPPGRATTY
jgi:hypothetical protein